MLLKLFVQFMVTIFIRASCVQSDIETFGIHFQHRCIDPSLIHRVFSQAIYQGQAALMDQVSRLMPLGLSCQQQLLPQRGH